MTRSSAPTVLNTLVESPRDEGYSLVNSTATVEDAAFGRKFRNIHGMGWLVTCLFIVGETAGGGLIAMPTAVISTGLLGGIIVILLGAIICAYTGNQLSENWTILQERWPEYRHHCRKPYPAMGYRALGPKFMSIVSLCLDVTQFGTAVVFMLLAAKNLENFLHVYGGIQIGFCYLVVIVAIFMLPFTMLKSPKDFWWAVIAAMITTTVAVALIIFGSSIDYSTCAPHNAYPPMRMSKFFMSFGTVMFAYGGHGAFPTIQHDMKKPYHFRRSVFLAFAIICTMYAPVSVIGYSAYGNSLHDSIIPSLQNLWIQQAVNVLITLHVVLALTIVFNPINQEFEEMLNVPQEFGVKRVLCRSAMMAAVVFVAETVPEFGVLLDLVGGSTITLMALIFPVIFNLFLHAGHKKHEGKLAASGENWITISEIFQYTSKGKLTINLIVLAVGVIGGLAATWSATNIMLGAEFSPPCYAGIFHSAPAVLDNATIPFSNHGKLNCCGMFRNVSRIGLSIEVCLQPDELLLFSSSHG
uniref:Amino acid transporter transmembrane domain-containing protein n=1 Tax=Parascaris univalens TaxID=6257 RepID=A0A914ZEA2_PARUN